MPGAGKKEASLSKTEIGSELISSFKFKKGSKISSGIKRKPNSKSNVKTIGSTLSNGKVTDLSSKKTRNDSSSKLISRKILHKALETKSSKKWASSNLQQKNSSVSSSKSNPKYVDGDVKIKKLRNRKKTKRQKLELDEASRLQRRTRYLVIKMKLEQNLIDAYSAEGWKGQSREKIKPEKELQRAKKQILECKLGIRDAIRQLDSLSSVGSIEGSVIAPDGSVHHEHIFCAKCKLRDAFPDNDIVLCDGTCNRAFHQKCLDPPLDTENIPPGDQGWFCKFCDCKMEIIDALNAHIGTCYSADSSWQDIFKEEAAFPEGGNALLNSEADWPSDDSEDDDYYPDTKESSCSISDAGTDADASDGASSSTSLSWSSDGERYSGFGRWGWDGMSYENHLVDSSADSGQTSDGEIIHGRRQRRAVDYKKLYDEMFGKEALTSEQISEDEDWGPMNRKRKEKESDAVSTLMRLYDSEKKSPNVENTEVKKSVSPDQKIRKPFFRIPPNAVEKLRQVFAENELPSRAVKENLSKELGLQPEKVSKWFKNARYMALKTRKAETALPPSSTARISTESESETLGKKTANSAAMGGNENGLKTIGQRKESNSLCSTVKKNQPANFDKVNTEISDDISLKKLLKGKLKKEKKKVNLIGKGESQAAEAEMERLCRAKDRLENLKQKLSRLQIAKSKKSKKTNLHAESVIYVPIAELREKV